MTKYMPKAREINNWVAIETHEDTLLVQNWVTSDEALLSWGDEAMGWTCSECGLHSAPGRPTQAVMTCPHVVGGLRELPVDTAVRLGMTVAKARKGKVAEEKASEPDKKAIEAARAAIARAEAKASVGRHDERDDRHREISGEVVVRPMTDEDRRKLEERRRRKKILAD